MGSIEAIIKLRLMDIYIHNIEIENKNGFSEQFNLCSKLWNEYLETEDESIFEEFWQERMRLELGMYDKCYIKPQ